MADVTDRAIKVGGQLNFKPPCEEPHPYLLVILTDKLKVWKCESCGKQIEVRTGSIQQGLF
jgi:hypothetical protein